MLEEKLYIPVGKNALENCWYKFEGINSPYKVLIITKDFPKLIWIEQGILTEAWNFMFSRTVYNQKLSSF